MIRIYFSKYTHEGVDTNYKFIQWIATEETVIAICEDLETGQIKQFKLSQYTMAFVKELRPKRFMSNRT